jgi:hypothetical protein
LAGAAPSPNTRCNDVVHLGDMDLTSFVHDLESLIPVALDH